MARQRDPKRDMAFELFKEFNGDITNREIAKQLNVDEKKVAVWKQRDKWNGVVQQKKSNVVQQRKRGGQPGNKNSVGNDGGAPKKNQNAKRHGFFSRFIPQETLEIMNQLKDLSPADMIWDMIEIKYAAIIRAQEIMFVVDKDDMAKEKSQNGWGDSGADRYDIQFAWDRHATFLNAQSRAMGEFRSMIKQFVEIADTHDERRLKLSIMQQQLKKLERENNSENTVEDKLSKLFDAIEGEARGT